MTEKNYELPKPTIRNAELMKIKAVSRMLGYEDYQIRRWCKTGAIKCVQPNGHKGTYYVYVKDNELIFNK